MYNWISFSALVVVGVLSGASFAEDVQIIRPGASRESVSIRQSQDDRNTAETRLGRVPCDYVQHQGPTLPAKCCSKEHGCLDTEIVHPTQIED